MPIYEYECTSCGETTERECKISERPKRIRCAHCHSMRTHQVISDTTFQLKGGRWFKDGYGGNVKKRVSKK
jgi:putative FmdB family regulatory protein